MCSHYRNIVIGFYALEQNLIFSELAYQIFTLDAGFLYYLLNVNMHNGSYLYARYLLVT